jgi:hypothetical protein
LGKCPALGSGGRRDEPLKITNASVRPPMAAEVMNVGSLATVV